MKRVVVTGMGIVSSIGNDIKQALASLQNGASGITHNDTYKEMGFRSHISGSIKDLDLKAHIDRKQLQIKQAQAEVVELQEKIKTMGLDSEQMMPEVMTMAAAIKQGIETGIPFKYQERASVIDDITRDLEGRKITSQHAINRLWAFLEDEMRLARENAIYSQTIELEGEQVLVDVAKLGTVLMYFKTRDDRYGHAVQQQGQWQFKLFEQEAEQQAVAQLFDALKKQIRQGYFELPLTLTEPG